MLINAAYYVKEFGVMQVFEIQLTFRNFLKIKHSLHKYYEALRAGTNVRQLLSKPIFVVAPAAAAAAAAGAAAGAGAAESYEGFEETKEVDPMKDAVAWTNAIAKRIAATAAARKQKEAESFGGFEEN